MTYPSASRPKTSCEISQSELEDFFDNVSVPLHLVAPDGTIARANDAELELLGYAREDYVGRNIVEFHVDRPTIDDILLRLKRGEKLNKYPSKLRCQDGSIKDVEISTSARFVNGEFINTRCCTVDVTKREEFERALRANQADLSAELEAVQLLQAVGSELIHDQGHDDRLYHKLAEAAAAILQSDYASMQMLYPDRGTGGELRLLASRGFRPGCGQILGMGSRQIPDVRAEKRFGRGGGLSLPTWKPVSSWQARPTARPICRPACGPRRARHLFPAMAACSACCRPTGVKRTSPANANCGVLIFWRGKPPTSSSEPKPPQRFAKVRRRFRTQAEASARQPQ